MNWFLGTSPNMSCVKFRSFPAELDVSDLAGEHLGEAALEASGDKQDSQVWSCLSLMLETDIYEAECLPGPHLCFRLEEVQEGCCRSWLIVCVFSLLTFTFWLPPPATRCVLTKELMLLNMFFQLASLSNSSSSSCVSLCGKPLIIWLEEQF